MLVDQAYLEEMESSSRSCRSIEAKASECIETLTAILRMLIPCRLKNPDEINIWQCNKFNKLRNILYFVHIPGPGGGKSYDKLACWTLFYVLYNDITT